MEDKTVKSLSDAIGKVSDLINPTDEVKKAGFVPIAKRIAQTFLNKQNLKNRELDDKNIILKEWQKQLAKRTEIFLSENPEASYNEANEYLLKKQIADSTFSLNNNYMRERFAKLIATTAMDFDNEVTPLFSNVLSNLDHTTAKLFFDFKNNPYGLSPMIYFGNKYTAIYSYHKHIANSTGSYESITKIAESEIAQLISLGLIAVIEDYKLFIPSKPDNDLYATIRRTAQSIGMNEGDIKSHAAIRITDFGEKFFKVVY